MLKEGGKIYEGKAKTLYETGNPEEVILYYKDDATAFNNKKKGSIANKGVINAEISRIIYDYLTENGVPTHFLKSLDQRRQLCRRVKIIPLEVILRNIFAGSAARLLGIEEGQPCPSPIVEICYKNDGLGDPLINDSHALALGLATREELDTVYTSALIINKLLQDLFEKAHITLVDFKIEFGRDSQGRILLADEISPDSCRLWDKGSGEKLDKDRFRRDLGYIEEAYEEVLTRIKKVLPC